MTYQVLARKWRPQDFASVVGQEPIITALRNGLKDNRIAQAYLFSGIRGVGKTTAARVLAKALNCERGPDPDLPAPDPCNQCTACTEITAGRDLDVLEVDAATYSKVEQVRELTESLRYGPARDRYKVVVLDEVHRLSRQAFDALLKIVEEPPPHLVFIFATTEIDAVPTTILSRCQELRFRRVASQVLAGYLRRISDAEEIEVSKAALRMLARAGEGSVRDSVALLDQLATFGNSTISDSDASRLLGGLDTAIFHRLLAAVFESDSATVNETVREIEANGWDPHNVYGQFLHYVRDALHLVIGASPDSIDLPEEESRTLADLVQPHGYENTLRLLQHLLASEPTVRRSEFALLALELAWLRAAELPKLTRIEDLLTGSTAVDISSVSAGTPREQVSKAQVSKTIVSTPAATSDKPRPRSAERDPEPEPPSVARRSSDLPVETPTAVQDQPQGSVAGFRNLLATRRQPLAALFDSADLSHEANQLRIIPQPGDSLLTNALQREKNKTLLEELLREIWGPETTWIISKPGEKTPTDDSSPADSKLEAQQDSTVQAVLEVFGGNIQSVQQPGTE